MAARDEILRALRAAAPPEAPLPGGPVPGVVRYPDPAAQLAVALQAVGGVVIRVAGPAELAAEVAALAARLAARRVVCEVPELPPLALRQAQGERGEAGPETEPLAEHDDARRLDGVDLAVLPGAFAVAENGAVWLPTGALRHRGVFVIAEHLALVVRAADVVNDMHEAYARLRFDGAGFGAFVTGPSKTADIEQALVIGAHGPRSCTVLLVG